MIHRVLRLLAVMKHGPDGTLPRQNIAVINSAAGEGGRGGHAEEAFFWRPCLPPHPCLWELQRYADV